MLNSRSVFTLIFIVTLTHLCASDFYWVGPDNGYWSNPANWDQTEIPKPGSRVFIENNTTVNLGIITDTIEYLEINQGSLNILNSGKLIVRGDDSNEFGINVEDGDLSNGGKIFITANGLSGAGGMFVKVAGNYFGIGDMEIFDLPDFGEEAVRNEGKIKIEGCVNIRDVGYFGLWNFNVFDITKTGKFKVTRSAGRGFQTTTGICNNRGKHHSG